MNAPHSTPPCDDACESQDLELLKANIAEHGPASICVNAATWNDYVEVRVRCLTEQSGVVCVGACLCSASSSSSCGADSLSLNDNVRFIQNKTKSGRADGGGMRRLWV